MTHEILETSLTRRDRIGTAESLEAAIEQARGRLNVAFLEIDADHPECADFITAEGMVGSIQPIGFKL